MAAVSLVGLDIGSTSIRAAESGRSDHQDPSAFARSRSTTPSGHAAPAATQARSVSTSSGESGSPSFGISARSAPAPSDPRTGA